MKLLRFGLSCLLTVVSPHVIWAQGKSDAEGLVAALSADRGGDCALVETLPGADVLMAMGAPPQWTAFCAAEGQAILAAELPQGNGGRRWLEAAALQLLAVNDGRAVALVDLATGEVVAIRPDESGGADLARSALPPPERDPTVVFDGTEGPGWLPLAYGGGIAEEFLRYGPGGLEVQVPAAHGWGSTGIQSAEPLLAAPFAWAETGQRLRLRLDPQATTGMVLALMPLDKLQRDDWGGHEIRLAYVEPVDAPKELIVWTRQQEQGRYTVEDKAVLADLSMTLWPGGWLTVQDAAGKVLIQAPTPDLTAGAPLHVFALASAATPETAVGMVLHDIRKDMPEAAVGTDPATPLADAAHTATLFDGTIFVPRLVRYNAHGGDFAVHARIKDGALVVDVPDGSGWGKVGFYSPDPVVWLDQFKGDAEVRLTLDFDAARTTGFIVALTGIHTLLGNDPNNPRFIFHLRKAADGMLRGTRLLDYDTGLQVVDMPGQDMPDRVELVLTSAGVQVLAPGFPDDPMPWAQLTDGAGLRLHVYSHPDADQQAVQMALKAITVTRNPSTFAPVDPLPAEGVEDLPRLTLFGGKADPAWVPFSLVWEKTFDDLARYDEGWLVAEVPAIGGWGRVGLLSDQPVMSFDRRLQSTPYRLRIALDPSRTDGFTAIVSSARTEDMWGSRAVYAQIVRLIRGPHAGRYRLTLDTWSGSWSRDLDPDWLGANWDGTLDLEFGDGWSRLAIPDGVAIRGVAPIGMFSDYHMVLQSVAPGDYDGARLALGPVIGGYVTPGGMDALTRMTLIDDEAFDPAAFVDLLGAEMTEILP